MNSEISVKNVRKNTGTELSEWAAYFGQKPLRGTLTQLS